MKMAIPKKPVPHSVGGNMNPEDAIRENDSLELPEIHELTPLNKAPTQPNETRSSSRANKPQKAAQSPRKRQQTAPEQEPEIEDEWLVDKKTGKKYKRLASSPKEAVKMNRSNKGTGLTLQQMQSLIEVDEDFENINSFSGHGLDDVAETFLSHLRVPPDRKEIARLREERLRQEKEREKKYKAIQDEISAELDDDDDDSD